VFGAVSRLSYRSGKSAFSHRADSPESLEGFPGCSSAGSDLVPHRLASKVAAVVSQVPSALRVARFVKVP